MPHQTQQLPQPNQDDTERSNALKSELLQHIEQHGPMDFAAFMEQALYHPKYGYYQQSQPFGAQGDFITASHCGPYFAQCLANQFSKTRQLLSQAMICEFGAGDGQLALDVLQHLQSTHQLPDHYFIVEKSVRLRATQQQKLAPFSSIVSWVEALPENYRGIIFANELLDAMPFQRFKVDSNKHMQQSLVSQQNGELIEFWQPAIELLPPYHQRYDLPKDHIFETSKTIHQWLDHLYQHAEQAVVFCVDYGMVEDEYFSRSPTGYARAFYQHHVHDQLLRWPGLQDLTTHINFSELAEQAFAIGWDVEGFTTQADFLVDSGVHQLPLPPFDSEAGILARAQIKKLLLPQDMGEMFKVIAFAKGCDFDIPGFKHDLSHRL